MNNLDIYTLLNNKEHRIFYKINYILIVLISIIIYIICTCKYQSYYIIKGKMINNKLELKVPIEDIKYFKDNYYLLISNKQYNYEIANVSNLFIDDNYHNYIFLYLDIDNLFNVDNYIYEIKIPKENKPIIEYLKNYL